MLGKRGAPETHEDGHLLQETQPNAISKNMLQVQFLLDKYMHAEKALLAKNIEMQKKDMEILQLKQNCERLSRAVTDLEFEKLSTVSSVQPASVVPQILERKFEMLKYVQLIGKPKEKPAVPRVNPENKKLKLEIEKRDYQIARLKWLLDKFFGFSANLVETMDRYQNGVPLLPIAAEEMSEGQMVPEAPPLSLDKLSMLLTESYSMLFDEQAAASSPTITQESAVVLPHISRSPSPEKLQKSQSEPPKATVQMSQEIAASEFAYVPPAVRDWEMQISSIAGAFMLDVNTDF